MSSSWSTSVVLCAKIAHSNISPIVLADSVFRMNVCGFVFSLCARDYTSRATRLWNGRRNFAITPRAVKRFYRAYIAESVPQLCIRRLYRFYTS